MNSSVVELIELIMVIYPTSCSWRQVTCRKSTFTVPMTIGWHSNGLRFSFAVPMPILFITPMKVANAPTPIVMASVKVKNILEATHNLHCLRHTEKLRIYDARIFSCNNASFCRWHNRKVKNIVDFLSREKRIEF